MFYETLRNAKWMGRAVATPPFNRDCGGAKTMRNFSLGFTLVELLVVIAVLLILMSLLLPALKNAQGQAKKTQCAGNLKSFGNALYSYCDDYSEWLPPIRQDNPPGNHWYQNDYGGQFITYLGVPAYAGFKPNTVCQCPVNPTAWHERFPATFQSNLFINYGGNKYLGGHNCPRRKLSFFQYPSRTFSFADATVFHMSAGSTLDFDFRHSFMVNCVYLDGHISSSRIADIPAASSNPFWNESP